MQEAASPPPQDMAMIQIHGVLPGLGKIPDVTRADFLETMGEGNVTVTLFLE